MSYQGRGRSGRGTPGRNVDGRGRGKYNNNNNNKETYKSRDGELKFTPYGSNFGKPTATYDAVKDNILQFIQKSYKNSEDIVVSLRDEKVVDLTGKLPTLGIANWEKSRKKHLN